MNLGLLKPSRNFVIGLRCAVKKASGEKQKELLETALAYERMIERAKRHFGLEEE